MPSLFRSKNEQVYEYLRSQILHGEIKPGTRLVIDTLAEDLGVSQIPIREALRQLEADGFVRIEPYLGAHVTEIDATSIHEIFEVLESLEIISGRAACQQMTDAELNELEMLVQQMEAMTSDQDQWSQYNKQFHQMICEKARMPLVKSMMTKILDHWDRLRLYYFEDVFAHRVSLAQAEHVQLVQALRKRDTDALETSIREHNRASLNAYMDKLATIKT